MLASANAMLAVEPARWHGTRVDAGLVGLHPEGHPSGAAYEIRAFFSDPLGGLVEDSVCGSLNASVAQWLIAEGNVAAPYQPTQGSRLTHDGRIAVSQDNYRQVWIVEPFVGDGLALPIDTSSTSSTDESSSSRSISIARAATAGWCSIATGVAFRPGLPTSTRSDLCR